jgi:hypothetical protein
MADRFSAQWWNDQAKASGGLTKGAVEALTGMAFQTKWNPDGSIAFFWYNDVIDRAPGFAGAGLLLNPGAGQGSRDVMQFVGDPNWGDWSYFTSPVGYVAPGATTAYTPTLSPTYNEPAPTSEPVPGTSGQSAPSAPPDELVSFTPTLNLVAPSVNPTETISPADTVVDSAGQQSPSGAPATIPQVGTAVMGVGLFWGLLVLGAMAVVVARERER